MKSPLKTAGLRHVALNVTNLEACRDFYVNVVGMTIEWQPDADNIYLTSGNDNLALHRATRESSPSSGQRLDHIGFLLDSPEDVDAWHAHMQAHGVTILKAPKTHRDGARSFYCEDPDGVCVQMIYHPPLASTTR
ncbi:MAG: VOC family protein [Gammaproteobacteria bacterium]|nr:VOC family protein [Gammaproteobacteria bacterium]